MNDYVNELLWIVACTGAFVTLGLTISFLWGLIRTLSIKGAVDSFKETIRPALLIFLIVAFGAALHYVWINPILGIIILIIVGLGLVKITPIE